MSSQIVVVSRLCVLWHKASKQARAINTYTGPRKKFYTNSAAFTDHGTLVSSRGGHSTWVLDNFSLKLAVEEIVFPVWLQAFPTELPSARGRETYLPILRKQSSWTWAKWENALLSTGSGPCGLDTFSPLNFMQPEVYMTIQMLLMQKLPLPI